MIVTVTLNTALDHVLHLPRFEMDRTIRASRSTISMGGKGTDASYILGCLGIPSRAMGFRAGIFGQKMEAMLKAKGVETDFVSVDGETRLNTLMISEAEGRQSSITVDTLYAEARHVDDLLGRFRAALPEARCVVVGGPPPGSVSAEVIGELVRIARSFNLPTVVDTSGESLKVAYDAGPSVIKPNQHEFDQLVGRPLVSLADIQRAGVSLLSQSDTALVITLGKDGALAFYPDAAYRIPALEVDVANTAGGGDAILAGLAAAYARGQAVEEGLRLGFAAAAAVMLTPGTAECRAEDVARLRDQVRILRL